MNPFLPGFYFALCAGLLLLPFRWCVAWITAAAVHELSHIAMLRLCRCKIMSVRIGAGGAVICADCDAAWKKILCTAAGPVGGAMLLFLSGFLPRLALCGLLQSAYNLLPFSDLDGGKVLNCLMGLLFPGKSCGRFLSAVETAVLAAMVALALYGTFWLRLGAVPLLIVGILLLKNKKSLAKRETREYNSMDNNIRKC